MLARFRARENCTEDLLACENCTEDFLRYTSQNQSGGFPTCSSDNLLMSRGRCRAIPWSLPLPTGWVDVMRTWETPRPRLVSQAQPVETVLPLLPGQVGRDAAAEASKRAITLFLENVAQRGGCSGKQIATQRPGRGVEKNENRFPGKCSLLGQVLPPRTARKTCTENCLLELLGSTENCSLLPFAGRENSLRDGTSSGRKRNYGKGHMVGHQTASTRGRMLSRARPPVDAVWCPLLWSGCAGQKKKNLNSRSAGTAPFH